MALRHHCQEGNLKWVSLLLWAGADPFTLGESELGREIDHEDGGLPAETGEIIEARRSLLKMTDDYPLEFAWIMSKYQACSRTDIKTLLKTPTIKKHTKEHRQQLDELVDQLRTE